MCQNSRLGLRPRPRWGSLQRSPDPRWEAASRPIPKNPTPASAFGLNFRPFGPQTLAPRCPPPKYHYSPPTLGLLEYTLIIAFTLSICMGNRTDCEI